MTRHKQPDPEKAHNAQPDRPCCQEMLQDVMSGAVPADQYVERMLDHLERMK